ncbi:MAG: hypothetical protein ACXW2U_14145 [Telluria sp.]
MDDSSKKESKNTKARSYRTPLRCEGGGLVAREDDLIVDVNLLD